MFAFLYMVALVHQKDAFLGFDYGKPADQYLSAWAKADRFSGAVLVARGDHIVFRKAYGYADWQAKTPMTLDTPCIIFSISKQFTAAAILMLRDRHRLDLADPITKYLPDAPKEFSGVTIKHLLTHTSGIDIQTILKSPDAKPAFSHPPGETYEYSNFGYTLLGRIVERVSQRSYSQFLQENIFGPLKMTHSGTGGYAEGVRNIARGHAAFNGTVVRFEQDLNVIKGAGNIHSTVDDMLRWSVALDKPGLLSALSLKEMFTPWVSCGNGSYYGFGWFGDKQGAVWQHSGGGGGFEAQIERRQRGNFRIIMLANETMGLPYDGLETLADGEGATIDPMFPASQIGSLCGLYRFPDGSECEVRTVESGLVAQWENHSEESLAYQSDGSFQYGDHRYRFTPGGGLSVMLGGRAKVGKPYRESADGFQRVLGTYRYANMPALTLRVSREGNRLTMTSDALGERYMTTGPTKFLATPLGHGRFRMIGLNFLMEFTPKGVVWTRGPVKVVFVRKR